MALIFFTTETTHAETFKGIDLLNLIRGKSNVAHCKPIRQMKQDDVRQALGLVVFSGSYENIEHSKHIAFRGSNELAPMHPWKSGGFK